MRKLFYRFLHPRKWHMRWQPNEFRANLHSDPPGVYWHGRFFRASRWQDVESGWAGDKGILCAAGPSLSELAGFAKAQAEGAKLAGVNGAIRLRDRERVSFDLFMMTDPNMVRLQWDNLVEAFETSKLLVISPKIALAICQREPALLEKAPFLLVSQPHEAYGRPRPSKRELERLEHQGRLLVGGKHWRLTGFSFDPQWGVFAGGTVTVAAIQVLAFLGLKQIAIAGMDLSGGQHFYKEAEVKQSRLVGDYETRIEPALYCAAQAGRERGFELANLSAASRLPETIIAKQPPQFAGLNKRVS